MDSFKLLTEGILQTRFFFWKKKRVDSPDLEKRNFLDIAPIAEIRNTKLFLRGSLKIEFCGLLLQWNLTMIELLYVRYAPII